MNKHFKIFLLVAGGALLVSGTAIFAAGCKNTKDSGKTREFDLSSYSIKSFNFDCDTSDIEFVPTTDSTMKVVYKETEKVFHTEEVKDDTLFIKQVEDIKWYERVFTFDWTPKKATIYLPAGAYQNLKVENSTGEFKVPHDFSFDSADVELSTGNIRFCSDVINDTKIKTSTGDVYLENISTKSLTVKRSTGDLSMKKINVDGEINIEGDTGKVGAVEVRSASIKIKSSTGDVALNDVKTTGELSIETSTGDVSFADIDFATGNIKTSTGDVKGTLSTPKFVDADSNTGNQDIDSDRTIPESLTVRTSTGDIKIKNK